MFDILNMSIVNRKLIFIIMKRDLDLIRDILLRIEKNFGYIQNNTLEIHINMDEKNIGTQLYEQQMSYNTDFLQLVSDDIPKKDEYLLFHLNYLKENGIFGERIKLLEYSISGFFCYRFDNIYLSPKGHEFLDSIRHKDIFEKIKATAQETGGNFTLELVKELGISYLKKQIGL